MGKRGRKFKGREFNKKGLSPARLKRIIKSVSQKHPEAYARLKDGPGGNQDEVLEDLLQGTERRSVIITKCKLIMKKTVTGTFFG